VKEGIIFTNHLPAYLQSKYESMFPGRGHNFNAEIDGRKMVIWLGAKEGTIEYIHHVEVIDEL